MALMHYLTRRCSNINLERSYFSMAVSPLELFHVVRKRLAGTVRLGEALVRAQVITESQLELALEHQQRKGYRLGYHLVKLGFVDEETLGDFLAEQYGVPAVGEKALHIQPELFQDIPEDFLQEQEVLPLNRTTNSLTLVMADPTDRGVIRGLEKHLSVKILPVTAPQSVIHKQLADYFALRDIQDTLAGSSDDKARMSHFFTQLRDFRFQEMLGVGGFGMVCKCWQVSLDRPVAIKTMNQQMSRMPGMKERFKREGKIIASLNHPNIIQVYEQGEAHGLLYIVMEYFRGEPLDVYCREKDLVEKLGCLITLCDALHYAYKSGVIHRDLKPANILANEKGEVKLLDFGVAQHQHKPEESALTRQNMVLGTPKYMAPECFKGAKESTTLADIYAMGVIAYELITGVPCKPGNLKPPRKHNRSVPLVLDQVLRKALELEADRRLSSFDLFKRALALSRDQLLMGHTSKPVGASRKKGQKQEPESAQPQEEAPREGFSSQKVLREDDLVKVSVCKHPQMRDLVVVKQVRKEHCSRDTLTKLSDIKHPNITQVLGHSTGEKYDTVIMPYLEGGSLEEKMRAGPIRVEDYVKWCEAIVTALSVARQRGAYHGRLHPGNILFTREGQLQLVDFGFDGPVNKTHARYTRPELRDAKSRDYYALGVLFFEMLSGERFRGASSYETNFEKVLSNRNLESFVKMPLARLWGIPRFGEKYKHYQDILLDLKRLQEKFAPETTSSQKVRRTRVSGQAPVVQTAEENTVFWNIFWIVLALLSSIAIGVFLFWMTH